MQLGSAKHIYKHTKKHESKVENMTAKSKRAQQIPNTLIFQLSHVHWTIILVISRCFTTQQELLGMRRIGMTPFTPNTYPSSFPLTRLSLTLRIPNLSNLPQNEEAAQMSSEFRFN